MSDLQELKKEADDLGVPYAKNITAEKLAEKIEEYYTVKENAAPVVEVTPDSTPEPKTDTKEPPDVLDPKEQKRRDREKTARETRIISIVDNDQRVNNHTTTCTVNCSNEFFDLGTMIFPLNEKIEVAMGHIRTLEDVKIPLHVTDTKTGMSTVRMRPRYTISYYDNK